MRTRAALRNPTSQCHAAEMLPRALPRRRPVSLPPRPLARRASSTVPCSGHAVFDTLPCRSSELRPSPLRLGYGGVKMLGLTSAGSRAMSSNQARPVPPIKPIQTMATRALRGTGSTTS